MHSCTKCIGMHMVRRVAFLPFIPTPTHHFRSICLISLAYSLSVPFPILSADLTNVLSIFTLPQRGQLETWSWTQTCTSWPPPSAWHCALRYLLLKPGWLKLILQVKFTQTLHQMIYEVHTAVWCPINHRDYNNLFVCSGPHESE